MFIVGCSLSIVDIADLYIKTNKESPVVRMLVQYVPEKRREEKGREGRSPPRNENETRRYVTKRNGGVRRFEKGLFELSFMAIQYGMVWSCKAKLEAKAKQSRFIAKTPPYVQSNRPQYYTVHFSPPPLSPYLPLLLQHVSKRIICHDFFQAWPPPFLTR